MAVTVTLAAPWFADNDYGSDPTTSASFTVAVGDLLVIPFYTEGGSSATDFGLPINSGTAFTWTKLIHQNTAYGTVGFYSAIASAAQTMTATIGNNSAWDGLKNGSVVWKVTGYDPADPFGLMGTDSASGNDFTENIAAEAAGSVTIVIVGDYQEVGTLTSADLQGYTFNQWPSFAGLASGWKVNTAAGAGSYSIETTAGGTGNYNTGYLEIRPAPAAPAYSNITFIGSSHSGAGPTEPAGCQEGDIALAVAVSEAAGAVTGATGFTLYHSHAWDGLIQVHHYWARRGSSALATNWTAAGGMADVAMAVYRGCATTGSPIDSYNPATAPGTPITYPSLTPTRPGCMIVGLTGQFNWSGSQSTDFANERFDSDQAISIYDDGQQTTATATGPMVVVPGGGYARGTLVALAPVEPPTWFTDDFNRADGALGPNWTLNNPNGWPTLTIVSNAAEGSYQVGAVTTVDCATGDQVAEADIFFTAIDNPGVTVGSVEGDDQWRGGYSLMIYGWDLTPALMKDGTLLTNFPAMSSQPMGWHRLRLEKVGSNFTGYIDGVSLGTVTDPGTLLTGKRVGFFTAGSGQRVDNFAGGDVSAEPAGPFTPADMSDLVGWHDASVTSSLHFVSGDEINQWDDLSGNGHNIFTSSADLRPSVIDTLNGMNVVSKTPAASGFLLTTLDLHGVVPGMISGTQVTWFGVIRKNANGPAVWGRTFSTFVNDLGIENHNNSAVFCVNNKGEGNVFPNLTRNFSVPDNDVDYFHEWIRFIVVWNGTTCSMYINGVLGETLADTRAFGSGGYSLGYLTEPLDSSVAEFGLALSASTSVADIDEYLEAKWFGAPAPFTPTDLPDLVGWWDATDATTMTLAGSLVNQWRTKNAGGPPLAPTSGNPPSRTGTINGLNAITHSGGTGFSGLAGGSWTATSSPYTVAVVVEIAEGAFSDVIGDQTGFPLIRAFDEGSTYGVQIHNGNNFEQHGVTPGPLVITAVLSGSVGVQRINGVQVGTTVSGSEGFQQFYVGLSAGGTHLDGKIGEIVVCDGVLSTADLDALDDYLVAKWIGGGPPPVSHVITASGTSTSTGSAAIVRSKPITASGTSVSTGTAAIQVVSNPIPATFFAAGTLAALATGTSITATIPASTVATRDVAIVVFWYNASTAFTTPSGWSLLGTTLTNAALSVAFFWKRLAGGDANPATTVTTMSATNGGYGRVYVWRDVGGNATPFEDIALTGAPTSNTTPATTATTTDGPSRQVVAIAAVDDDPTWSSGMPPAGWTNVGPRVSSTTGGDGMTDAIQILANTTGQTVAAVNMGTMSAAANWRVLTVAVVPARLPLAASGTSTSTGTAAIGIRSPVSHAITASGTSTSTGTAAITITSPAPAGDDPFFENFSLPANGTTSHTINFTPARAGAFLMVIARGAVTHDATGWTKGASGLNSNECCVLYKTATAGESSVVLNHNGSNWPIAASVIQFPGGGSYSGGVSYGTAAWGEANPTLSGLTPDENLWVFAAYTQVGTQSNANWSAPNVEGYDVQVPDPAHSGDEGDFAFSWAYQEGYGSTTYAPAPNIATAHGYLTERITFAALCVPVPTEPVLFTDDFNRANSTLAAPWVTIEGVHSIVSNKVAVGTASPTVSYYNQTFAADQWVEADLAGLFPTMIVPTLRVNGSDFYYLWSAVGDHRVVINKRVGGSYSQISGTPGPDLPSTGKARVEVEGTTFRVYLDGVLSYTGTDSDIATGRPGILSANGAGATLDNFRAGDLPYTSDEFTPAALPGLVGWWDGADAASFTLSGANVTQWSDKSGTHHLTVPGDGGSVSPTRVTADLTAPVVRFNGTSTALCHIGSGLVTGTTLTIAFLARINTRVHSMRFASFRPFEGNDWQLPTGCVVDQEGGASGFWPSLVRAYPNPAALADSHNEDVWVIGVGVWDGTNQTIYVNNVAEGTAASTGNFSVDHMFFGRAYSPQDYWDGDVAEIVVSTAALDATQRTDLYDYLQEKWLGEAPAVPPVVQSFTTDTADTKTVAKPSGVATGDKIVIGVYLYPTGPSDQTPAITGFTLRHQWEPPTGTGLCQIYIFDRDADGSEGSSFAVTGITSGWYTEMVALRVSGAGDFHAGGNDRGEGTTTGNLQDLTVGEDASLALGFVAGYSSTRTITSAPAGWTQVANFDTSQYVFRRDVLSAGVVTDTPFTWSAGEQWSSVTAYYEPSGGAPPGPTSHAITASGTSTSSGSAALRVAHVLAAPSVVGLSTTTATMAVARALVAVAPAGVSTTTAAMALAVPLSATSTGLSSDTGVARVAVALVATTTGLSNTVGSLGGVTAHLLVGTAGGLSTTTAAMAVHRPLSGSVAGLSTTTAAMATADALQGAAAGLGTTTGALSRAVPVAGSTGASSTTTGTMAVATALVGTTTGLSVSTGSLARAVPLSGTAAGLSSTTAVARNAVALVGTIAGTSQTQGLMEGTAATTLAGTSPGTSTTTGAMAVAKALVAITTPGTSTTTAALATTRPLSAVTPAGISTTTGAMAVARSLVGTTPGGSTTTGTLVGSSGLGGSAAGGSTTTGALAGMAKALSASAGGTSSTTGTLTAQAPNSLTGSTGGGSTTTGVLGVTVRLGTASASGLSSATGALSRAVPMTAVTVPGSSTSTATAAIGRGLGAASSGLSTATATTRIAVALVGTAGGQSAVLVVMSAQRSLSGASVGTSATMGMLRASAIYGLYNGQAFDAMQFGGKEVIDWLMVTS